MSETKRKLSAVAMEAERLAAAAGAPAEASPLAPDGDVGQDIPPPADLADGAPSETPDVTADPVPSATIAVAAMPAAGPTEIAPEVPNAVAANGGGDGGGTFVQYVTHEVEAIAASLGIPAQAPTEDYPGPSVLPADTRPTREKKKRMVNELNDQIISSKTKLKEYVKAENQFIAMLERDLRRLVESPCQGE